MRSGKAVPLDAEPSSRGYVFHNGPNLQADTFATVEPVYTSHFATCPDADKWRKRK